MIDPDELLEVARGSAAGSEKGAATDAQLRRAVSTAYYALFHKVVGSAASRFMGTGQERTAGYAVLYRSFEHKHMSSVCEALQSQTLKDRYKRILQTTTLSQNVRDFAAAFPGLQQARHMADYDPTAQFLPSDVDSLVDAADVAMTAFGNIDPIEQADILALLMVSTRA